MGSVTATAPLSASIATSTTTRGRANASRPANRATNHHTLPVRKNSTTFRMGDSPSSSCPAGMPAQKYMASSMAGKLDAVPRSGSFATSTNGTSAMNSGGSHQRTLRRSSRAWSKKRASTNVVASLATSDGWNWNGPNSIQRLAPSRSTPMANTATSASSDTA